jgi:hypothetical protein
MRADFADEEVARSFDGPAVRGEDARLEIGDTGFTLAAQILANLRFVADEGYIPRTLERVAAGLRGRAAVDDDHVAIHEGGEFGYQE